MTRPDAVVTDLDGSLLGPDLAPGPRDRETVRRLLELGIPVVPGTGRPPFGFRPLAEELGFGLALCSNGGCRFDFREDRVLSADYMDTGTARRLMDWILREGYTFIIHTPRMLLCGPGAQGVPHFEVRGWEKSSVSPGDSLEGYDILKFLIIGCDGPAVCRRAQAAFPPEELAICSSNATLVDFNPPGVDKGRGLRALAASMGWDLGTVLALGDNYNDLTMLEAAGLPAAPASAVPEVRAAAAFVSSPAGEDPLTGAVEHFFPGLLAVRP